MSMSRGRNAEKEKNRGLTPIARASNTLRCFFGRIQLKRKTAAVLIAAMMTGTMADSLNAVGLGRYANAYASSSDAIRAEEDDSGGGQSYSGSAESYYLEDAQEDLDLQLNGEELKEAMESEEPLELNYLYLPYEEEAAKVAAYDEIKKQAGKDYRLLDQGFLQTDDDKVSYFVYGKKGKKSSNWIDDLKVFVLNGYDDQEKDGDYNVYFTIDSDELEITQGKVGVKVFKKSTAPTETAGGNVVTVGEPEESTTAQPTEEGTEPTEEIKIVTDQEESSPEQSEDIEESGTDETEKPEETSSEEAEEPESSVPEETKKAEETSSEEIEEPESPAPEETEKLEETSSEEIEEPESSAPKETEKLEKADEPKEKTEAQEPVEREEKTEPEGTVDLSEAGNSFSVSRHAVQMVMATPSDAKEENLYGDADAQIAAIREETTVTLRFTSKGKGYTFSEKELQLINMEEEDEEEEEDENPGIARFLARISRMAVKEQESHNILASPKYSVTRLDAKMRTQDNREAKETVAEMAERLYGSNGTGETFHLTFTRILQEGDDSPDVVYPGGSINFTIDCRPERSELYQYNGINLPLFDEYEDVYVYLKLPKTLELTSLNGELVKEESDGSLYRFNVSESNTMQPGGDDSEFSITVKVAGNGGTPIGTPIQIPSENIYVESNIKIKDKSDSKEGQVIATYPLHVNAEADIDLKTGNKDAWKVSKSVINPNNLDANGNGYIEWDNSTQEVVVVYKVEIGLANEGKILSNSSSYGMRGRSPMGSFNLEDTLSVTAYGSSIELKPNSVKIWKFDETDVKDARTEIMGEIPHQALVNNNIFRLGVEDLETCRGKGLSDVADSAPYYTAYLVEARYPMDKFYVEYPDTRPDYRPFTISNEANISYTLMGCTDNDKVHGSDRDTAQVDPKKVRGRSSITIYKKINDPINGEQLYGTLLDKEGVYLGYAEFTIENVDNNQTYTVAVNPKKENDEEYAATGKDGFVTVDLPPGKYTITETHVPGNTAQGTILSGPIVLQENDKEEVTCINQSKLGAIKFQKVVKSFDHPKGVAASGIQFGLYSDPNGTQAIKTATSDKDGKVVFNYLTPGTYYVKEIASTDYIRDERVYTVTVTEGNVAEILTNNNDNADQITTTEPWVNTSNLAKLKVNKWLVDYQKKEDGSVEETRVTIPNPTASGISFLIQEWGTIPKEDGTSEGGWVNVGQPIQLSADSNFEISLPVEDANGNKIQYQIVESLPAGYSGVAKDGIKVTDSTVTVAVGELEPNTSRVIDLDNTKKGSISLNKTKIGYSAEGNWSSTPMAAKFKLYRKTNGNYVEVKSDISTNINIETDEQYGKCKIDNLPIAEKVEGQWRLIEYYLEEDSSNGYNIEVDSIEKQNDGKIGPITLTALKEIPVYVKNVERKVPFWIYKEDAVEQKGVGGAKFRVEKLVNPTDKSGTVVPSTAEDGLWISGNDGYAYIGGLEPNAYYKITEVSPPEYYKGFDDGSGKDYQIIRTGDVPDSRSMLSKDKAAVCGSETAGYKAVFQNEPIPEIQIEKKLVDSTGQEKIFSPSFDVYTRSENEFNRVTTIEANTFTRNLLPGVDYYFKEVIDTTNNETSIIDPIKLPENLYAGLKVTDENNIRYFGPYNVTGKKLNDQITLFSLNNYQYGSIQVEKRDALTGQLVTSGTATFKIESIPTGFSKEIDTTNGYALFTDLPVFDSSGNRITYKISEITPPDGYNTSNKVLTTQVIPGEMITHAVSENSWEEPTDVNSELVIKDEPHFSITAKKVWRDDWNYQFHQVDNVLGGVDVALFEKVENNLVFRQIGTTDNEGEVTFNQLDRTKEYYVIEVSSPEWLDLPGGKQPLPENSLVENGSIPVVQVERYNFVKYDGSSDKTQETLTNPLVNHKTWAQLNITKVCRTLLQDGSKEYLNGAIFDLYQVIDIPEGTKLSIPSDDDLKDPEKYRLIDTYESGTKLNTDGTFAPGQFDTTILEYGNLYWLVERESAPGHHMLDGQQYTLYYPQDGVVKYTVEGGRTKPYFMSRVTSDEIENEHNQGDDGLAIYWAQLKLNKWLNKGTEAKPEYQPLGGVKYQLWLLDQEGNRVPGFKPIILETGLNTRDENLRGEVLSDAIKLDSYKASYSDAVKESDNKITLSNNTEVPEYYAADFELLELSAPAHIQMDMQPHKVTIYAYVNKQYQENNVNVDYYCISGTENGMRPDYETMDETNVERTRLINTPLNDYRVIIRKYGYTPSQKDLGWTDAELDAHSSELTECVKLEGVGFKLQRLTNGAWVDYPDNSKTYRTDDAGIAVISGGLPLGTYRLQETLAEEQKKEYAAKYEAERYLTFTVGTDGADISVYNPRKPKLEIYKTGMDGKTPIPGIEFTVTVTGNGNPIAPQETDSGGKAIFTLDSGIYTINETKGNDEATNEYFGQDYGQQSVTLGYCYVPAADQNYYVLQKLLDSSDDYNAVVTKSYKDPANFTLKIYKQDADSKTALKGAEFTVWYLPFTKGENGQYVLGNQEELVFSGRGETKTTVENGYAEFSAVAPGWYKIQETQAPAGYSLDQTSRIIAVNTDLQVIRPEPENILYYPLEKGKYEHQESFENKPYIPITITKNFSPGDTQIAITNKDQNDALEKITFDVYVKEGEDYKKVTVYQKKGDQYESSSLVRSDHLYTGYVEQTASNEFYVKENRDGANWYLVDSPEYILASSSQAGGKQATAAITNTLGKAVVIIKKVDLDDSTKGLSGAEFKVYNADPTDPTSGEIRSIDTAEIADQGDGTYKITIPVTQNPQDYYIKETKAPATYELSEKVIPVIGLKAGDRREYNSDLTGAYEESWLSGLIIADKQGIDIKIEKYSNIKERISGNDQNERMQASFYLYYSNDGASWNRYYVLPQETSTNGELTFTNLPALEGRQYAIEEKPFESGSEYADYELDSVYKEGAESPCSQATIMYDGSEHQVHILDTSVTGNNHTIAFKAYNMPAAELTVRKVDVSDGTAKPTATFDIYPEGAATASDASPYKTVTTVPDEEGGSSAKVNLKPGNYYIVERQSDSNYGIVKDNKNVVWEQYVTVNEGDKTVQLEKPFANVKSGVKPTLVKETLTAGKLENMLMTDKQEVRYRLKPGVKETIGDLPLKSFMVMDSGLTMQHLSDVQGGNFETLPDVFANEKYTVKSVTLTGPTRYENEITGAEEIQPNVKAIVSFYKFGKDISKENRDQWSEIQPDETKTVSAEDLRKGSYTVEAPQENKYKGFSVTYVDDELQEKTGYAVGSKFDPGTIEVTMMLDRQLATETYITSEGEREVPARTVDKIVNDATTLISYLDWDSSGNSKEHVESEEAPNHADSSSEILAKEPAAPQVTIKKTVTPTGEVKIGDILTYYIKLENILQDPNGAGMADPIIVDKLPKGLELIASPSNCTIVEKGESLEEFNQTSGGNLEDTNQDGFETENVEFRKLSDNYILFRLDGKSGNSQKKSLSPGSTVILKLTAKVGDSVIAYSMNPENHAYATTYGSNVSFKGNEYASTFKDSTGAWAHSVTTELENVMDPYFKAEHLPAHGFISDHVANQVTSNSNVKLVKLVAGDKDPTNFVDEKQVARVTNDGYALYQLIVNNGSENYNMARPLVADIMPYAGDKGLDSKDRYSKWNIFFNGITSNPYIIRKNGTQEMLETSQFQVWVTEKPYSEAHSDLEIVLKQMYGERAEMGSGWSQLSEENKIVPNGFQDNPQYTAFVLEVTDQNIELEKDERLIIPIKGKVPDFSQDNTLNNKVYTLADNDFSVNYYNRSGGMDRYRNYRTSPVVQVLLEPEEVEVGGRIWIDANNDGVQQKEEYNYYSEPYIQTMLKEQTVKLSTYTGTNDSSPAICPFIYEEEGARERGYIDDYGRWTGQFYFNHLSAAAVYRESELYKNGKLDPLQLVTPEYVHTYKIQISIPENFKLAKQNAGIKEPGRSRKPKELYVSSSDASSGSNREEAFDSNYGKNGNEYESEHFFLWQTLGSWSTNDFDYTKDLGLVPYRDVTIRKSDEHGNPIDIKPINDKDGAGADIKIYGPFKPGEITADMLIEGNLAGSQKTGSGSGDTVEVGTADGKAVLKANLLAYMQYVIVEENPASGYTLDGAAISNKKLTEIEIEGKKAWILPSAASANTSGSTTAPEETSAGTTESSVLADDITITNKYQKGSLAFDKVDEITQKNLKNAEFELRGTALEIAANSSDPTFEVSAQEFIRLVKDENWQKENKVKTVITDELPSSGRSSLTFRFISQTGSVNFDKILPRGAYALEEIQAPDGYDIEPQKKVQNFDITASPSEAKYVKENSNPITNVPQQFMIEKVAEQNGETISGVTFTLALASPSKITLTTDDQGRAYFNTGDLDLEPKDIGRTVYRLEEEAKDGYQPIDPIDFMLEKADSTGSSSTLKIVLTDKSADRGDVVLDVNADTGKQVRVIRVTNTLETGSLTLRKELTGNDKDLNWDEKAAKDFEFTIQLNKPDRYTNPVVAAVHGTDSEGKLVSVNAILTKKDGTTEPQEYLIDADGKISGITLKADESIQIDGIYYGTSYTVEEIPTVSTGYEFASTSDATRGVVASSEVSGTIRKNQDNSVTIRNTIKKASITLAKTFDSDIPDENDLPTFDIYDITDPYAEKGYTLYGSAAAVPDDAVSVGTIRIHEDTSIEGQSGHYIGESEKVLLPGHYYQIVEKLAKDDISKGYTAKVSGEIHVTVGENNRLVVAPEGIDIENNRTKGWLMVSKKLLDHDNDEIQESRTFYYKLYRRSEDDGEWREVNDASGKSIRSIQSHGEPDKLFVDFGTYRIRETDEGGNPYGDSVENLEYMVSNPDDIRVELREEGNREEGNYTFEAPITNTERPLGKLTITKQADYAEAGSRFYFTVKDGKGRYVQPEHDASGNVVLSAENAPITEEFLWEITAAGDVTYEQNGGRFGRLGTVSLDRMPYGTYTVTEVNADGTELDGETYIYTPLYQISVGTGMGETGNAVTGSGTGTIHIDQKEMTVTVTNRRSRGYLEIQKILQDAYGNSFQDMSRSFYYTVLDADGAAVELPEEYRYNGNSRIGRITTAGTHRLYLPFGTYRVLETDETGRIYDGQNQNERYDVTNPEAVTIALENADTAQAVIINKEKALGSLTVTKRTDWTPSGNTFYFQVVNEQGTRIPMPDEAGNPTAEMIWRIEAQNSAYEMTNVGSLTMRNLPYGSYTVTEVTEAGEELSNSFRYVVSYEASYQGVVRTSQSGTVDIISPAMTVTVTNTRRTANGGGTGGGGGTGSRSSRTTGPATEFIPDADVPLGMTEGGDGLDTTEILDEDVPLFGLPKTGDTSASAAGLLGLMLMSLLGAVGITRKRRKEEE